MNSSSETQKLQPIVPAFRLCILSDEQLGQLQSATLEILDEVGIHCPTEKGLAIYAEHGARVDFESQIVKLPPDLIMETLSCAPRFYTMGARSARFDLELDGTATYCGIDGCGSETIDFISRKRRVPCKDEAQQAEFGRILQAVERELG